MREKIFFKNRAGQKLCGILSVPGSGKNVPVVVLCHGFSSSKDSNTYVSLESALNEKGIATFRFDFFGHGESQGKFEEITVSEAVDEAMRAIALLKEKGFKKIGLFGSSFGGQVALISAARTPGLFVLALKSPVSDYLGKLTSKECGQDIPAWREKGFVYYASSRMGKLRLNYSFFEDAEKFRGYEEAKKISIPALIVHGDKDKVVPLEQSVKTASIIPGCRLEVIKGADHKYSKGEDFEKMLKLISEFVAKNS